VIDSIQVKDTITAIFDLPLELGRQIILTKDTPNHQEGIAPGSQLLNSGPVPCEATLYRTFDEDWCNR
jgi:hypothetical protein